MTTRFMCLVLLLLISYSASAQAEKRKSAYNLSKSGLAIEGYDPVAYFTDGKGIKGNSSNAVVFEGVTYYFSNVAHKDGHLQFVQAIRQPK